ncbi:hypothetical protein ACFVFS_33945 [Kitasatospora sp. NPDC057692]|uniref:hypothetical protein n=1 Tax=Kitasatospora sp. NPDC057692 TaxID=3346215 RepID=UPI00369DFF0D
MPVRKSLLLNRSVRRMAAAAAGCLALLPVAVPASTAQAATNRAGHRLPADFAHPVAATRETVYDPVYLVQANSGRGATFEVYAGWDYALLTNQPGNGTALVFTLHADDLTYSIASTSANWGEYRTWCLYGADIRLEKSSCRTRWVIQDLGGEQFHLKVAETKKTVKTSKLPDAKRWLAAEEEIFTVNEEFVRFRLVHP